MRIEKENKYKQVYKFIFYIHSCYNSDYRKICILDMPIYPDVAKIEARK